MEKATFGAGCFWGIEEKFRKINGVVSTRVGYSGGTLKNPTYKDVCSSETGHAEVVEIGYDPSIVSYEELINIFWNIHDPTSLNRQGWDIGTQYRSVIFYHNEEQKKTALLAKSMLEKAGKYKKQIVTEIKPVSEFFIAEEYHQRYIEKNQRTR
ncbi:MAG: peptide-methionine (S)-S-oxide reductase [Promethearchaeota archaeon Loki_b31]|nr:MAG: peptide-methionine (S)-S-oxide reductase [Candidatus Lokiarchaeota archaeon Loki_b31]